MGKPKNRPPGPALVNVTVRLAPSDETLLSRLQVAYALPDRSAVIRFAIKALAERTWK